MRAKQGKKILFGTELSFYEITYSGITVRLIPCTDPNVFSEKALKNLLLSENGSQINAAIAFSKNKEEIAVKAEFI